jgi:hypothetical protein
MIAVYCDCQLQRVLLVKQVCFEGCKFGITGFNKVRNVILVYILSHQEAEFRVTSHERVTVFIRKASCKKGVLRYHFEYHNSLLPVVNLSPDAKIHSYFVVLT